MRVTAGGDEDGGRDDRQRGGWPVVTCDQKHWEKKFEKWLLCFGSVLSTPLGL